MESPASQHFEKAMSPEKTRLLELEQTEKYLFHGSGAALDELHPKQAVNAIGEERIPDGEPAVFASTIADYAIFMAIVNKENSAGSSRSSVHTHATEDGVSLTFGASRETLENLRENAVGFVYVFDREHFAQRQPEDSVEYISTHPVQPLFVIRVSRNDLPSTIETIDYSA